MKGSAFSKQEHNVKGLIWKRKHEVPENVLVFEVTIKLKLLYNFTRLTVIQYLMLEKYSEFEIIRLKFEIHGKSIHEEWDMSFLVFKNNVKN